MPQIHRPTSSDGHSINRFVLLILLIMPLLTYTESIVQAAVGSISMAFPAIPADTIKQLQTVTPLITMFSTFACGTICRKIDRKTVLLSSMVIMSIGGLAPLFFGQTFGFLLGSKIFFSVGYGLSLPIVTSVIVDLLPAGDFRNQMIGWRNAVGGLFSVLFAATAGWLAGIHYRLAYLCFLVIIPFAVLVYLKLPRLDARRPELSNGKASRRIGVTRTTIALGLFNIFINLSINAFFSSISLVIVQSGAGTSAQAGLAISAYSATAFVTGLFFAQIIHKAGNYTLGLSVLLEGICFLILSLASSYAVYIFGSLIFGVSFGVYNPTLTLAVADSIRKPEDSEAGASASNTAFSVIIFCQAVGQCFSTVVLRFFSDLAGLDTLKGPWQICFFYLLFSGSAALILTLYRRHNAV